jgi:linoleoyl-CoA desaturase
VQSKNNVKFDQRDQFHTELQRRIDAYFTERRLSRFGGARLMTKSAVIGAWLVASYLLLVFAPIPLWAAFLLAASLGTAMAAVGFNVTHDANHDAFSRIKWVNSVLSHAMDLIGGSSYVWRIKHNVIHHTYTNISGIDDDINLYPWGRLAPGQRRLKMHRLQPFYIWPLYGMLGIKWHFDDVLTVITGKVNGQKVRRPDGVELACLIGGKLLFVGWALVVPMLAGHAWWTVLGMYFFTEFVMGVVMSLTFQLAHCVEEAQFFPTPATAEEGQFQSWARHQIETTVDFAPRNFLITWYMGGLNFQIEHHLFPRISHVHYPKLAPIVKQVSDEFGVRYTANRSFLRALFSHVRWLHRMGQPESA